MRRPLMLTTALLATTFVLAGCSSGMQASQTGPEMVSPEFGGEALDSRELQGASSGDAEVGVESVAEDRQVIVTGFVTMTVERPREAADDVARIVEGSGGFIDARTEMAPGDNDEGRAELTVRIPSDKRVAVIDRIEELGTVEESVTTKSDVTSVARDLDARITALQASVDRLLALMVQANSTADLITIESALSERQANLESLQSQRRSIAEQVDFSTITIHLGSQADAPIDEPDTFWSGLITGWEALVAFLSFLLVALGVVLPWLVLPALATLIVLLLVRRARRRRARRHGADAAAPAEADARPSAAGPAAGDSTAGPAAGHAAASTSATSPEAESATSPDGAEPQHGSEPGHGSEAEPKQ